MSPEKLGQVDTDKLGEKDDFLGPFGALPRACTFNADTSNEGGEVTITCIEAKYEKIEPLVDRIYLVSALNCKKNEIIPRADCESALAPLT